MAKAHVLAMKLFRSLGIHVLGPLLRFPLILSLLKFLAFHLVLEDVRVALLIRELSLPVPLRYAAVARHL